jgi:hypothetical protein
MLIDWPEQKRDLQGLFERAVHRQTIAGANVVAAIPHVVVQEGDRLVHVSSDGVLAETKFAAHEASSEVERSVVARGDTQALLSAIHALSGSMAESMETDVLSLLREAPENQGTVFRGSTGEQMAEEFVRAIETIDFGFDDDGKPSLAAVMHPDSLMRLKQFESPELQARIDSAMEKKRLEWIRRESYRRLVD